MNSSSLRCGTYAGALLGLLLATSGCSGRAGTGFHHGMQDDGGTVLPDGAPVDTGMPTDGVVPPTDSGHDSSVPDTSVPDTAPPPPVDTGTLTSPDGFGTARTACIDEINKLRATQALAPYTLVDNATVDSCVDSQASYDEAHNSAHDAWINNIYPTCNGNAQDECEGYGTSAAGIKSCLDSMWAEQYNSNCKGCVGCTAFGGACTDCDFYGMYGPECGHYVNMSAVYFTEVWCGFAASPGTWATQNFQ